MSEKRTSASGVFDRLGNPLKWSDVDKATLLAAFCAVGFGFSALINYIRLREGSIQHYLRSESVDFGVHVLAVVSLASFALVATGVLLRKRSPNARWFLHLCVQFTALITCAVGIAVGTFTSPYWALFLIAGSIVCLILFDRSITSAAIASYLTLSIGTTIAERTGRMPYAPILEHPPYLEGRLADSWVLLVGGGAVLIGGVALFAMDFVIARSRQYEAQLEALSTTDPLTGLLNRRAFLDAAAVELARHRRYPHPLSLMIVDLDHFKRVNDTHGHPAGDETLRAVARVLREVFRQTDTVARFGGEEFIVLLPETDTAKAAEIAERCRALIEHTAVCWEDSAIALSASLGLATLEPGGDEDLGALVARADAALYRAKESGRNRVVSDAGTQVTARPVPESGMENASS